MDTVVKKPPTADMVTPSIELVPITACANSPTNPRKHFDKVKLAELAESIREHGILQPLLVRPLPDSKGTIGLKYEIVAGERRWRAAKLAGHAHVPVSIRSIPDDQVLELQLTENLQRDDLAPLEEADGYKQLMVLKKINADQLAELLGKSRSYVYTRTKLNDLCPEARKALIEGKLDASRALLIARIGHHDTQRQCLKDALANRYDSGPMSYRALHEHIAVNYMLRLVDAPFDAKDPALLPKAGPCTTCPKRTGNQPDLFGDVKRADVCTDPKCFDDKRQAHFACARKELEAAGKKTRAGQSSRAPAPTKPKGPDVDEQLHERLVLLIHEKAPEKFGKADLLLLARKVYDSLIFTTGDDLRPVAKAFGWPASTFGSGWSRPMKLPAVAQKLSSDELPLLMLELIFASSIWRGKEILQHLGIKESAERDFVIAERKKAQAAARAAKKTKGSTKPAAKAKKN